MKRWLWSLAVLSIGVGVVVTRGQEPGGKGPVGPGDGGAVLRLPGMETTPARQPVVPDSMKGLWNPAASAYPTRPGGGTKIAEPQFNQVEINKDIEITPASGQFVIVVMSYAGPQAPVMARDFVIVLRRDYKLPAYVYNKGAEEKRKEYERVQKIRQEQIEALQKANLKTDVPIRVPTIKIEEQTAVLIGGYKTFDEATNALKNTIRKLNTDALKGKVDLDASFVSATDYNKDTKTAGKTDVAGIAYINPFLRAFPARNPVLAKEQVNSTSEEDLAFLRKVNKGEPLTLLECKKPFTLAIKQFNMQHKTIGNAKEAQGFLASFNNFGLTFKKGDWEDMAARNAHNLAEALRKSGLPDTYVLHCKHCSYVTVGGFESLEDPRLLAMQNFLETGFKAEAYRQLELFPRPVPMPVPGVSMR